MKAGVFVSFIIMMAAIISAGKGNYYALTGSKVSTTLSFLFQEKDGSFRQFKDSDYLKGRKWTRLEWEINGKNYSEQWDRVVDLTRDAMVAYNPDNPSEYYRLNSYGIYATPLSTILFLIGLAILFVYFVIGLLILAKNGVRKRLTNLSFEGDSVQQMIANKSYVYKLITGIVMEEGQSKYSETHVNSSGGSAYVAYGGIIINPPKVTSTTTLHHEFWLKLENGEEYPINLTNVALPIKAGQKVSGLLLEDAKSRQSWVAILNHSTAQYRLLDNGILDLIRAGWISAFTIPTLASLGVMLYMFGEHAKEALNIAALSWIPFVIAWNIFLTVVVYVRYTRLKRDVATVSQDACKA